MDQPQVAVVAESISKRFADQQALSDVSFTAERARVTGLLGPNGAGKTTLIRILTTVLSPTGGSFSVAGCSSAEPVAIRSRIGVMPENAGYPKRERAIDHLIYHGRLFGAPESAARQRARELLTAVGLGAQMAQRIGTFSRGMRQRLGLARSLMNEPEVLFLDEPTLGLDPVGKRDILDLVRLLADQRGAAVVLTSHLLEEIERICDRAVILKQGVVVHDAPVSGGLANTFLEAIS